MTLKLVTTFWTPAIVAFLCIASSSSQTPTPPVKDLNTNFVGKWTGQLEYRDFQSNAQVLLPTWLSVTETPDQKSLQFNYVYDDGPTKIVRELITVTLDPTTAKMTFTSDHNSETYAVQGLDDFAKLGRGILTLTGPGKENDKPVDVRITVTLRRNLYTLRKETRHQGEDFKFRDAYTFTRAEPSPGH
jgi:hypothetical protein